MRKIYLPLLTLMFSAFCNAQVAVTASGGTPNTSYATLKAAFDAINTGIHSGTITVGISADITETASAVLNASGSGAASYSSIIISPTGGATRTISGTIAGPLIDLNGADNITIDGLNASGNTLTISNTAANASGTIRFIADATGNIITNCTILGSASGATSGVVFFSTGVTTGNDGNNINHCNITAAGANLPLKGIYSLGTSAAVNNSDNVIDANNISDYFHATTTLSAGIHLSGPGNSAWIITNNRLFQTATRTYTASGSHQGININLGSGYIISGNIIGFANSSGTGTTNMVGNSVPLAAFPSAYSIAGTPISISYIGISCSFTFGGPVSEIQGNTIAGFAFFTGNSSGSAWVGINVVSGTANIGTSIGNIVGATSGNGSVYFACTVSGAGVIGIFASTFGQSMTIQNNIIGAIDAMGTTASVSGSIVGINTGTIASPGTGNHIIAGNTIGNSTNPNLRMGNLTTGTDLSNTGTFSATSGISRFYGILNYETGTITIGTAAMPNLIRNVYQNSTSPSTFARCIYNDAGSSLTILNNTVTEISSISTNTAFGDAPAILGIKAGGSSSGKIIESNNIFGLRAVNTGADNVNVIGIIFFSGSGNARKNKVFDLTNTNTGTLPAILGLWIWPQTNSTWTVSNNMVSLLNGGYTNSVQLVGIYDISTGTQSNYYFNTINIEGSASGGSIGSVAFWRTGTTPNSHRNNIYTNTRTGGSAIHYTILNTWSTPAAGWPATASDNNVLNNAGTTIGRWGATNVDFAGWQSNSLGDNNSISGIPLAFVNAATGDLHLNMGANTTQIESGGVAVPGFTIDYDNETRPGPTGSVNGGAFAPDIGADEFDGVPATTIYTFNGNGNWSDAANWLNNQKPPLVLGAGSQIFIDPVAGGQCVLDVNQLIINGAVIIVRNTKSFVILGNLNIAQ